MARLYEAEFILGPGLCQGVADFVVREQSVHGADASRQAVAGVEEDYPVIGLCAFADGLELAQDVIMGGVFELSTNNPNNFS